MTRSTCFDHNQLKKEKNGSRFAERRRATTRGSNPIIDSYCCRRWHWLLHLLVWFATIFTIMNPPRIVLLSAAFLSLCSGKDDMPLFYAINEAINEHKHASTLAIYLSIDVSISHTMFPYYRISATPHKSTGAIVQFVQFQFQSEIHLFEG